MEEERKTRQQLFIRICRDSGWRLSAVEAAKLAGSVLNIHPFEVYAAFGDMQIMDKVASGEHPVCAI